MSQSYARYVGGATTRRITERDFKDRGIEQRTLSWNGANGYSIPREDISDAAWEILKLDPRIILTDQEPTQAVIDQAKIDAAKTRLIARQNGEEAAHAQDPVPGVDESSPE